MCKLLKVAFALLVAGSAANAETTPAQRLIDRLAKVVSKGQFIVGQHDAVAYGHGWKSDGSGDRSDVKSVCGDFPGLMNWDLGLIEWQCDKELDGVPFDFIRREVAANHAQGGVNTFSWHVRNPITKGDSWDCEGGDVVHRCVTEGTVANDTLTVWLQRAAAFIGSLRDAEGNRIPVVFRPWHEHTGSWFWWGENHCSVDDYKALWRMTRRVFDEQGIDNVVWAYSPDNVDDAADYIARYPGDDYVDIMGADTYHFDGEKGVDDYLLRLDRQLSAATDYARAHGKLVAFTETGSEGLPMADWWTGVLLKAIVKYPIAYVCMWRNAWDNPKHFYMPFPGQASAADFVKFYKDKRTLFRKDIKKIK